MLPTVENDVRNFYNELKLEEPAVRNPFIHRVHISNWKKKLEIAVGFFVLFPVRFLACLLVFIMVLIWCYIATLGWNPPDMRTPLSSWRRRMRDVLPFLCRSMLFTMGFHKIKVKGKLAPPSEAPVAVIAPHSSFLDIFILCVFKSAPSGISKIENVESPFIGKFFQVIEAIGVSRDETKSRQEAVEELRYRSVVTRGQWPHICIFPEGTCTNKKTLISFKAGAFIPGCPIQPVCLRFSKQPDICTWTWDGPGLFVLFVLLLSQMSNTAEVEFLPVWKPTDEEKEDPVLYAEHVQSVMARYLELPVTSHTYEDTVLMAEAGKLGLPIAAGIIEFKKTATKLGMNLDSVKEHLRTFALLDSDKDGKISLEDFASHYNLPTSSHVKELFSIFDRGNKGWIDFRQYLVGSACVARLANRKDVLTCAFKVLQEFSRPNQTIISAKNKVNILESVLKRIDDAFSDNHNVRSRNEEFQQFLACHHGLTVLLSSLVPHEETDINE